MSNWKFGTRIVLLAAVMIGVGLLLPQKADSFGLAGPIGHFEYVYTEAAHVRTQNWECGDPNGPNNPKCLEMCVRWEDGEVEPTGEFMCFYG
ncbi:MAG: hypothetical protein GY719_19625 [bacterium]|nr:hypothetical protein [bacterium]